MKGFLEAAILAGFGLWIGLTHPRELIIALSFFICFVWSFVIGSIAFVLSAFVIFPLAVVGVNVAPIQSVLHEILSLRCFQSHAPVPLISCGYEDSWICYKYCTG